MTDDGGSFGELLRGCRAAVSLSQEELAERSGVSVRAIRDMERGRTRWPNRDSARRLADALGLAGGEREGLLALARRPVDGPTPEPVVPYRGLGAFREQDAGLFFGREEAAGRVLGLMSASLSRAGLVVVSGVSGAGKSSLLRAGVLPRLGQEGLPETQEAAWWPRVVFTPGRGPLEELAVRVAPLAHTDAAALRRELAVDPAGFALTARQAALAAAAAGPVGARDATQQRLVLAVDQCEQLFTMCPDLGERQAFIAALCAAATEAAGRCPSAVLLLVVRADFEARLAEFPQLAEAVQERFLLTGMTRRQLRLAITGPAAAVGSAVSEELVQVLLEEAPAPAREGAGAGALPLLSHALDQAWRARTGDVVTLGDYERAGGIEGAVATSAQRAYQGLSPGQQEVARQVFTRLAAPGSDGTDVAVPAARAELAAGGGVRARDVQAVLERFAAERLLTLDEGTVAISHEVLLTAWPLLRDEWLVGARADRATRARLHATSSEWVRSARDPSYLYVGTRLAEAAAAAARIGNDPRQIPLSQADHDFLRASRRAGRRRARTRQLLAALLVLATAIGVISVRERAAAAQHAAVIQSTELAADAAVLRTSDPGLAAQLAAAAYRMSPTEQAVSQLYTSAVQPVDTLIGTFGTQSHPVPVLGVAAQADGPLIAATDQDGDSRVWSIANPAAPTLQASISTGTVSPLALAPHAPLLAASTDRSIKLFNVARRGAPTVVGQIVVPGRYRHVTSTAISPDGTLLALASGDGAAILYDIGQPARPRLVKVLPDPVHGTTRLPAAVAFAPRGHLLAMTVGNGATQVWSLADQAHPVLDASVRAGYRAIAVNPSGTMLAAVNDDSLGVWVINPAGGLSAINVPPPLGDMDGVTFTPDGRYLAINVTGTLGAATGSFTLLDMSPGSLAQPENISPVSISSTSYTAPWMAPAAHDTVLAGGYDGGVRLWRAVEPQVTDTSPDQQSDNWALSADRHLLAAPYYVPGGHEVTGLWDISGASPSLTATIPLAPAAISFLRPAVLTVIDASRNVELWNVADPRHPRRTATLGAYVFSGVPFTAPASYVNSDDAGTTVTVLGGDDRLHFWRVSKQATAHEVGSLPVPGAADDPAGAVMPDGTHVLIITPKGIQWWDVSDLAHPVRIQTSSTGLGSGEAQGNTFVSVVPAKFRCGCTQLYITALTGRSAATSSITVTNSGTALQLSADHRLLALTSAGDNGIILWDLSASPARPPVAGGLVRTVGNVHGMALSAQHTLLADWNKDTVELWAITNPAAPQPVASITWPTGDSMIGPESVQFTPAGDQFAVGTTANSVMFLETDPARVRARICADVSVPITPAQWSQYAPGIPYQQPCPG